jgi:hypothetical protein
MSPNPGVTAASLSTFHQYQYRFTLVTEPPKVQLVNDLNTAGLLTIGC